MTDAIEAVARAIKAKIGEALNAKPLTPQYGNPNDDWFAPGDLGTIDLIEVAQAAIAAATPAIRREAMEEAAQEIADLRRMLWITVRAARGKVTIGYNDLTDWDRERSTYTISERPDVGGYQITAEYRSLIAQETPETDVPRASEEHSEERH